MQNCSIRTVKCVHDCIRLVAVAKTQRMAEFMQCYRLQNNAVCAVCGPRFRFVKMTVTSNWLGIAAKTAVVRKECMCQYAAWPVEGGAIAVITRCPGNVDGIVGTSSRSSRPVDGCDCTPGRHGCQADALLAFHIRCTILKEVGQICGPEAGAIPAIREYGKWGQNHAIDRWAMQADMRVGIPNNCISCWHDPRDFVSPGQRIDLLTGCTSNQERPAKVATVNAFGTSGLQGRNCVGFGNIVEELYDYRLRGRTAEYCLGNFVGCRNRTGPAHYRSQAVQLLGIGNGNNRIAADRAHNRNTCRFQSGQLCCHRTIGLNDNMLAVARERGRATRCRINRAILKGQFVDRRRVRMI